VSAIIIPNARIARGENSSGIIVEIPGMFQVHVAEMVTRCWAKHNGYAKVGIDTPFKPRTRRAQGKLHSLIAALAPLIDMSAEECKLFVKMEATALGYPMVQKMIGKRVISRPQSEADASTIHEHMLIETCLKVGAETGHDLEMEYENRIRGM
jgi:hypothetical protein